MIDTGDRVLVFKELRKDIPSYVHVRGWNAFVRYIGQLQICRVRSLAGHFAKDYPRNNRKSGDQQQKPPEGQSTEKPGEKSTHMPESKTTPMDTQPSKSAITQAEVMDTPQEFHIPEPDPEILKSQLDGIFGSISTDADDDIHSVSSMRKKGMNFLLRNLKICLARIYRRLPKTGRILKIFLKSFHLYPRWI